VTAVVLANDRQMHGGPNVAGLFLVAWGGLFGGIPLALVLSGHASAGVDGWTILPFAAIGSVAFFIGLYLVLARREVWLDDSGAAIEERNSFLGRTTTISYARKNFDRVQITAATDSKGATGYQIELRGSGDLAVSLGGFSVRGDAMTAGLRAARAAGFAFEEQRGDGTTLALAPAQFAALPAAPSSEALAWWQQPSAIALVAANAAPVFGVLLLDWKVVSVLLLFWLENVVIGLFNVAKILLAQGNARSASSGRVLPFAWLGNIALAAFFTIHYGIFCAVHGLFIATTFGRNRLGTVGRVDIPDLPAMVSDLVLRHGLIWAAIALAISHGVSFYVNFLKPRAYEDATPDAMMFAPYKRVVILHVVIIMGGFAADALGASLVPLLLLIGLKTVVDLNAHRREHAAPYERELRDFMAEHGHKFVRPDMPAAAQPAPAPRTSSAVLNDRTLAHFIGAWRADPLAVVPPGWLARVEFRDAGGAIKVKLWSQADRELATEGEFDATVRGKPGRVEFIEVRQHAGGRVRIARFTGSDAGASRIDLNEIQHPEGDPNAMQARSLTLQR
jgi:hypothetical protein